MKRIMNPGRSGLALAIGLALFCTSGCIGDEETKTFRSGLQGARVTVYPAVVRSSGQVSHDPATAEAIAAALGSAGAGSVVVSGERLTLSDKSSFNQAAMFKASLAAFSEQVKQRRPDAEYAAIAEYLVGSKGGVGGIHLYVVRADGSRAFGLLLNSHHKEFKAVWPRSNEQAAAVLTTVLRKELQL